MLSGETAYGKYAVEAVQTMTNIAKKVEAEKEASSVTLPVVQQSGDLMRNYISKSAVEISARLGAKVIITSTRSGDTAQICASYRCRTPIVAYSATPRTVRELCFTYRVHAQCIEVPPECADLIHKTVNLLFDEGVITPEDIVRYIGGGQVKAKHTNLLQIDVMAMLIK